MGDVTEPSPVRSGELVINAARMGSGRTHVEINAAIAKVAGAGGGTVFVGRADGPWTISRKVAGDQTSGGILIESPNITLESDGAVLNLADNCDFFMIRSPLGPSITITEDTTLTTTTLTVSSTTNLTVGEWVHLRLGQADYDAAEPDFWLWAKVQAVVDSTHVTLDRPLGYAMSVAATPTVNQRSLNPVPVLVQNVQINGIWNLVNPRTGGANAETGIDVHHAVNVRLGIINGTDTGSAVILAQFVDGLYCERAHAPSAVAQGGHPAKGRILSLAECRGATFRQVSGENFQRTAVAVEARCEGLVIDQLLLRNTFPGRSTTAEAVITAVGNARLQVGSLHLTGNATTVQTSGGTTGTNIGLGEAWIYTSSRSGVQLRSIIYRLLSDGTLYSSRRTWRKKIPLTAGMAATVFPMPAGQLAETRIYASTTTGITGLYLGSSATITANQVSFLLAGQTADLDQGANIGPGYNASDDTGKRLLISTDGTLPAGAFLVIETEYFADPAVGGHDSDLAALYA